MELSKKLQDVTLTVRKMMYEEIGEDEITKDQRDALSEKYGLKEPSFLKRHPRLYRPYCDRPFWVTSSEDIKTWNHDNLTLQHATKELRKKQLGSLPKSPSAKIQPKSPSVNPAKKFTSHKHPQKSRPPLNPPRFKKS